MTKNTPTTQMYEKLNSSFEPLLSYLKSKGYAEIFRNEGREIHYIRFQTRVIFNIENDNEHYFYLSKTFTYEPIITTLQSQRYPMMSSTEFEKIILQFSQIKK